jgi:hypothetical protein
MIAATWAEAGTIRRILVLALLAPSGASAAQGSSHCMTRILADVSALEAPEQVKSKSNGEFGPVTQIKVNRQSGRMFYCAKNSYCYDSNAFELTSPCRLKLDKSLHDPNFFVYFTR